MGDGVGVCAGVGDRVVVGSGSRVGVAVGDCAGVGETFGVGVTACTGVGVGVGGVDVVVKLHE